MRSFLAALRSLVLPYGATTGARIVLDGVNGQILIYDSNGVLAADIIPGFGFEVWDPNGDLRLRLSSPLAGAYSSLQMWTGVLEETNQALISLADFGPMNRMVITPGEQSSKGGMEWTLVSAPNDDSQGSLLQAVCLTLNDAGNLRPIVDLTGAAAPSEGVQPRTVVYDLWAGEPNGYGEEPVMLRSLSRGNVGYAQADGPTTLSTVAGTWTDLVSALNVPIVAGRRYRLWGDPGHSTVSGGSGFATSDYWEYRIQVDVGAGYQATGPMFAYKRVRSNSWTAAARWPSPVILGLWDPVVSGDWDFRMQAVKGSGAGTVTTVCDTNGGQSGHILLIEDIGLAA